MSTASSAAWSRTEPVPTTSIRVWCIDLALPERLLVRCDAWLDPEETARAERFVRSEDRDRYRASHAALRLILSRTLGVAADAIAYRTGPSGKPDLAGHFAGAVAFNLSHSGARALVGIAPRDAIGVDVEALRPIPDAVRIARAHFARAEAAALGTLPAGRLGPAFTGLWTRKEAVVKALGTGLSLPLDSFEVTIPPDAPRLRAIREGDPDGWTLRHLEPGAGTVGTAAVRAPGVAIDLCALPEDWTERVP